MIEISTVVEEKVARVEQYGVYLKHGDETILILAPEVSWQGGDIREKVQVGDTVRVKILRLNYGTGENLGSIKRLQQDRNPYRQLSRLPRGTVLYGWVNGIWDEGVNVHLSDNVWGYISRQGLKRSLRSLRSLKTGEEVRVVIAYLDVEEGKIDFDLAEEKANGPVRSSTPLPGLPEIVFEQGETYDTAIGR